MKIDLSQDKNFIRYRLISENRPPTADEQAILEEQLKPQTEQTMQKRTSAPAPIRTAKVVVDSRDARKDYELSESLARALYLQGELVIDETNSSPGRTVYQLPKK